MFISYSFIQSWPPQARPERSLFIFSFKSKAPWGLVFFLIYAFLAEGLIAAVCPQFSSSFTASLLNARKTLAAQDNLNADLLILGDSSAQFALSAKILEKKTGLKTLHMATFGDIGIVSNYYYLRSYLKKNRPPKVILLMNVYDSWGRGLRHDGTRNALYLHFYYEFLFDLPAYLYLDRDSGINFIDIARYFLPSSRLRSHLHALFTAAAAADWDRIRQLRKKNRSMTERLFIHKGDWIDFLERGPAPAVKAEQHQTMLVREIRYHRNFVHNHPFTVSGLNKYYLERFLSLTREKGIRVKIVLHPLLEEFHQPAAQTDHMHGYKAFIRTIAAPGSHVSLLTEDFYKVSPGQLERSIDHLNKTAAIQFSEETAAELLLQFPETVFKTAPEKSRL